MSGEAAGIAGAWRRLSGLVRLVGLDFLRSRGLLLAGIFVAVLILLSLAARALGGAEIEGARFALSFNLQASYWAALLVTWAIGVRQIAPEIENRTLHLILARPVGRVTVLLVRALATAGLGTVAMIGFSVLVYLASPPVPGLSAAFAGQVLILQGISILLLAVLTIVLSLVVPAVTGALIVFGMVVIGGLILQNLGEALPAGALLPLILLIPDFGLFGLVEFFVGGEPPVSWATVIGAVLYAGLFSMVWLTGGAWIFQRRAL